MAINIVPVFDDAELSTHLPGRLPTTYAVARKAIAKCWKLDEVKDWSDKAEALASYAKQANDREFYEMACRIQLRANRRMGELLQEIEASKGGLQTGRDGAGPSRRTQAAEAAGVSGRRAKTVLRVAKVPKAEFEAAVESDHPPSVSKLAEMGTKKKPVPLYDLEGIDPEDFKVATKGGGAVHSFVRDVANVNPARVVKGLKPFEHPELCADAKKSISWLTRLVEALQCIVQKT